MEERDREDGLRGGQKLEPGGGDDAQRALGADEQALEVVAGDVLADRATDGDELARRDRCLEPVTQSETTPYLNACGPPALVAMLPPICDCSGAPGSGANIRPLSRASCLSRPVGTPASTWTRHSSGSNERTRSTRSSARTTPPSGTAPPDAPDPPPRGTIGTSRS
jgi:hypothetical protein